MIPLLAYTDGAMCVRNPSTIGAGWAVVLIPAVRDDDPEPIKPAVVSGFITPDDMGLPELENNLVETVAILKALESVPPGYVLQAVFGDNANSIQRARYPHAGKWSKVPTWIRDRMKEARRKHDPAFVLIGGHPTRADLARGYRLKEDGSKGPDVSKWNIEADAAARHQCVHLQTLLGFNSKGQALPDGKA